MISDRRARRSAPIAIARVYFLLRCLGSHRAPAATRTAPRPPLRPRAAPGRPHRPGRSDRHQPARQRPGSLRAEIAAAAPSGDTIQFAANVRGTITLTSGELLLNKNLIITGPGANLLTVSGNHASRVFEVPANVSLSGLTIANGFASGFGSGGPLGGSGIDNSGTLTLSGCTISGNSAFGRTSGGGIFNGGTLTLSGCTISGNSAPEGGGIASGGGTVTVSGCTISGNSGTVYFGGGIANLNGTVTVSGCTISGNTTGGNGGGGGIENSSTMTVSDSTISGNTTTAGSGGGISNVRSLTVRGCTVSGNSALAGGGGISNSGGTVTLSNTIVAGNHLTAGAASDLDGPYVATSSYNLIGTGGSGGLVNGVNHNQVGVANPGLGTLGDHGGPTKTVPLLTASPALNAGDPAQLGTPDQRGVVRGGGVNIGAYQATATYIDLSAPATVTAGVAFRVTASARDPYAQIAPGFVGPVVLHSTDPQAPATLGSHTYTLADGGSHTFTGVTLYTAPTRLLYVDASGLPSGVGVTVRPAAASVAYLVPSTYHATPGVPFTVTLILYDAYRNVASGYTGTVHFTSSDPRAVLPADYAFTAADAGMHTFSITLFTPYLETVRVRDTGGAFDASAPITVF